MSLVAQVIDGEACGGAIRGRNCVTVVVGVLKTFGTSMRMMTHVAEKGLPGKGRQVGIEGPGADGGNLEIVI